MTDGEKIKAGALALCQFHCPDAVVGACTRQCAAARDEQLYAASIFRHYEKMAVAVLKAADVV